MMGGASLFLQTPDSSLQTHNTVIRSRKRFTRELRRLSERAKEGECTILCGNVASGVSPTARRFPRVASHALPQRIRTKMSPALRVPLVGS